MGLLFHRVLRYVPAFYVVAVVSLALNCDVNVSCNCCKDGGISCSPVNDYYCDGPCVDGHWGGRCRSKCPVECISCDQHFGQTHTCSECIDGRYGKDCSNTCPSCTSCLKDTGVCSVCAPGYYGTTCQHACSLNCMHQMCDLESGKCIDCSSDYFGVMCNHACSTNCKESLCDRDSGICFTCVNGDFGPECNQTCPVNCNNLLCYRDNGTCHECNPGYYGDYCDKTCSQTCLKDICDMTTGICKGCIVGYYGLNCTEACPSTCKSMLCDRDQGTCTQGCTDNYIGDRCEECIKGKYGSYCDQDCPSNCLTGDCNRNDGICTNGCHRGFSDSRFCCVNNLKCETCSSQFECSHCKSGTYGLTCDKTCPINCDGPCDKTSGSCEKCKLNHFGRKCETVCSEMCLSTNTTLSRCNADNGYCDFGCMTGYNGIMCDNSCSKHCHASCYQQSGECHACVYNRFGKVCSKLCPGACLRSDYQLVCSIDSGFCLHCCLTGFYGDKCDNNCSSGCRDTTCNISTGHCPSGCKADFTGLLCEAELTDDTTSDAVSPPTIAFGVSLGAAALIAVGVTVGVVLYKKRTFSMFKRDVDSPTTNTYDDLRADLRARNTEYAGVSYGGSQEDPESRIYVNTTIEQISVSTRETGESRPYVNNDVD